MAVEERPYQPPWTARAASSVTVGVVGFLCRSFLFALNKTEVFGLDGFLRVLDSRKDSSTRERGLITGQLSMGDGAISEAVTNDVQSQTMSACKTDAGSVESLTDDADSMDDPVIWGVLPFRYQWDPTNTRYSLGSYDILFNKG